jgi:hypothetical protein
MMALMLPVALAATGLVIDLGRMHAFKREMQSAADAAAMAAAQEWRQENYSTYSDAALEDAALNGFDENDGAEVDVHVPPTQGRKAGDAQYLEVVVRKEAPMYFMKVFREEAPMVEARAVTGLMPTDACLYVLDPHSSASLSIAGNSSVILHDCGVQVNSDSATAATSAGSATLSATGVAVVGSYTGSGYFPTPSTGVISAPDPLSYLTGPPVGGCTYTEKLIIKKTETLSPGTYCGGLEVTAQGNVTLLPGNYVIKGGGLKTWAGAHMQGERVMFYNTSGSGYPWAPINFHAGSSTHISAPTSGTYKGILFFNDRSITSSDLNIFAGTPDTAFTGVLYFANTNVRMTGDTTGAIHNMVFVANKVEFQGNTHIEAYNLGRDLLPSGLVVARVVE